MCSETEGKKNLSNLVSVAGTSLCVSRNEIRGGGEEVMKIEKKKLGNCKKKGMNTKHKRQSQRL